jgi:hypothetical protein
VELNSLKVPFGRLVDDGREVSWVLCEEGEVRHGVVLGGRTAGAGTLVDRLVSAAFAVPATPLVIAPDGVLSGTLADGRVEKCLALKDVGDDLRFWTNLARVTEGAERRDPHLIVVRSAVEVFAADPQVWCDALAILAAGGFSVLAEVDGFGVENFGGSPELMAWFAGGNVVEFRGDEGYVSDWSDGRPARFEL